MLKSKFARICDTFVFVLGFGIICFAWLNKYIKNIIYCLIISTIICLIVAKIAWNISTKKFNRKNLKTLELKFAQNCIDFLALNPNLTLNFFSKIIDDSHIFEDFLVSNNTLHYFDYSSDQTSVQTLAKINSKLNNNITKAYLYSSKLSEKCAKLLTQTNIVWVQDYDCYLIMKEKQIFPITEQKNEKIQRHKLKQTLLSFIARKKAKPYFFYGILLLLSSFVMPYSLLYCIVGTLSVVLSLICLIVKNNQEINGSLS